MAATLIAVNLTPSERSALVEVLLHYLNHEDAIEQIVDCTTTPASRVTPRELLALVVKAGVPTQAGRAEFALEVLLNELKTWQMVGHSEQAKTRLIADTRRRLRGEIQ